MKSNFVSIIPILYELQDASPVQRERGLADHYPSVSTENVVMWNSYTDKKVS